MYSDNSEASAGTVNNSHNNDGAGTGTYTGSGTVGAITTSPQLTSWDDVCSLVTRDDEGKWDRLVPRDELRLENGNLGFPRRYAVEREAARSSSASVAVSTDLGLTNWSSLQLCQRLGIPAAYYRRCPSFLQDSQVNHFLRHSEKTEPASDSRWLLRAKGNSLRGILSERYSRIDNNDVLHALTPALQEIGYGVRWFGQTEESLHLRIVDPRRIREVLPGDAVIAGLHVTNSEVGKRSITVDTMVWRLVCQNGLVKLVKGKNHFAQRHIGLTIPELTATLPEVIRRAVLEGEAVMDQMTRATTQRLSNPDGVIATIASDWGLSQAMEERLIAALLSEPLGQQETLYGLVNAVTQVAQSLVPDERYSLEALAGTLLESGAPAVRAEPRFNRKEQSEPKVHSDDVPIVAVQPASRTETSGDPRLALFGPDW